MHVIPQQDGSLIIDCPDRNSGFDMGNRSLFIKTNGMGDVSQVYFAYGAHAGWWRLDLWLNDAAVDFQTARAIGHLWQLEARSVAGTVKAAVFLEEKTPAVFERIEVTAPANVPLKFKAKLSVDISAPPAPHGKLQTLAAEYLPRLPVFSDLWAKGWARRLQLPSSGALHRHGDSGLIATGQVGWQFSASQPFQSCQVHGKRAGLDFESAVPAGQRACLEFVLVETGTEAAADGLSALPAALKSANEYADWLSKQIEIADPLLHSLYVAGLNASRSMFKEFPGGYKGLVAGPDYAFPPRIYFRDGYWTAQALIDTAPELVRDHLLHLAAGVHPDGQCPSGIFAAHLLKAWRAPVNCTADWLPDHFDSPSFFILLLNDYLQATQDWPLLEVIPMPVNPRLGWPERTVGQLAEAAVHYLIRQDCDGDGLIEKPYAANDWADNVNRSIWVAYDQILYIAALQAFAGLCERVNPSAKEQPAHYLLLAETALQGLQRELWSEELGYFINYRRPGFEEKNFSVDTLTALYFHLLDENQTQKILAAADFHLRAAHNQQQPYGDYGVLCAFPLYSRAADLFDKSALPYCYHNGADWPYWDGVYASILLERRDPAGLEVLSRWWSYDLEQGWLTPVEYYSPPYPVGGMLQGWSSMPAAVLLRQLKTVKELLDEAEAHHSHR